VKASEVSTNSVTEGAWKTVPRSLVFTQSEWPVVHSGGDDDHQGSPTGLYFSIAGGSGLAVAAGVVVIFLGWRHRMANPTGVHQSGVSESFTGAEGNYTESNWNPDLTTRTDVNVTSIVTLHGDDIDELL
jgi:Cu/Zn superoxide dismutase